MNPLTSGLLLHKWLSASPHIVWAGNQEKHTADKHKLSEPFCTDLHSNKGELTKCILVQNAYNNSSV